jgi:ribosomal protein S12 methylthiotransferase accessory factor
LPALGITRVANLTGLDRVGIPVVAAIRPNGRSYAVAQGKGITLDAAKASGVMESIENYHAEELFLPLRLGTWREVRRRFSTVDLAGLPRVASSIFHEDRPLLWVEEGFDLLSGAPLLLPYESVHLDFRLPRPQGSGCFLTSSNGLASGNHLFEALSHALCELIERDANTLWHLSGERVQRSRRVDLATVTDPACVALLKRFDDADIDVIAWDTTTDIGVPSIQCDVVDRDPDVKRPMPPVRGSGAHPCKRIALSRALTEAAQGRLTRISGSRDDLFNKVYDDARARRLAAEKRKILLEGPAVSFAAIPNAEHETVEEDVTWLCDALQAAGLKQIVAVNLTRADLDVPVVRVVVPHLETTSEVPGYVAGMRARRVMAEAL